MISNADGDSRNEYRSDWIDHLFREVRNQLPVATADEHEAAFRLQVQCGKSFRFIAASFGCSASTAHRRVDRVRRVMREHLTPTEAAAMSHSTGRPDTED